MSSLPSSEAPFSSASAAAVPSPSRRTLWLTGAAIALAGIAAYANAWHAPFVFDDLASIVDNPTIRRLWPPGEALSPPRDWGFTVSGRPVLNLSLAFNYAVSGPAVWSYRVTNVLLHALAGLVVFGLIRRTLGRPPLAERFGEKALPLAWVVALVWTLHPLQTESVTYTVQRAESLMGLCVLATLYAFARAVDSPHPRRWIAVAFVACLLGVGTKEVAVMAPVLALLYDRTFVSGSFAAAWRRHRGRHLLLAATWIPLGGLLLSTGGNRGGTAGLGVGVSLVGHWLTQFEAVTRYLWLALWPHPLVFDYGKIVAGSVAAVVPWAIPVMALLIATLVALRRWPVAGFLGAWFFLLLAPTSLVPGAVQTIVEHRMYLSLAGVVAFVFGVLALRVRRRTLLAVGGAAAVLAGGLTFARNEDYRSEEALWAGALAHRPNNARAHNNLGLIYYRAGKNEQAIAQYRDAVRLEPTLAQAQFNLGLALMKAGQLAEAVAAFQGAIAILPHYADAHLNLGITLTALGRPQEALAPLAEAVRFSAAPAEAHLRLGVALAALGRWAEASEQYAQVARLAPEKAEAHSNWGVALFRMNAVPAAIEHFNTALRLKPDLPDAHFNLGLALAATGRSAEAIPHYEAAVRLNPSHVDARLNLGIALGQSGRIAEAIAQLTEAARLRPDSPQVHTNLGTALMEAQRLPEALTHYEAALRLAPGGAPAYYNVGYALLALGRAAEARGYFESALRAQPNYAPAAEMLARLREAGP